jgi:single-strand DNA-binding protein
MAKSLNKVTLIGNLTRDPELRFTPQGSAVCTFGLATNRQWTTDSGDKKEDVEFHRIVSWNKLAEICSQLLKKGRKVYVEGRLQTRSWQAQDGAQKSLTEVVISDMILLDSKMVTSGEEFNVPEDSFEPETVESEGSAPAKPAKMTAKKAKAKKDDEIPEDIPDDIPF